VTTIYEVADQVQSVTMHVMITTSWTTPNHLPSLYEN